MERKKPKAERLLCAVPNTKSHKSTKVLLIWIGSLQAKNFIIPRRQRLHADKVCKELDTAYRDGDLTRIGELWKKRGAIGKLHNVVRYIWASPQHRQYFRSITCGGDLAEFDQLEVNALVKQVRRQD